MPKFSKSAQQVRPNVGFVFGQQAIPEHVRVAWKYVYCAGFDDVCLKCGVRLRRRSPHRDLPKADYFLCPKCGATEYERRFHHFEGIRCNCEPGPQYRVYMSTAFETAMFGGRGGVKTESGFLRSIRGNVELAQLAKLEGKQPRNVDLTYLAHPHYRILILRKNAKDMRNCWDRAKHFYGNLPVQVTSVNDSDMTIRFETGAEIVMDHMATSDAYEKYQGQEFQFIWAEELTQIPSEELYVRIVMSCRSSFPELIPSLYVTANPGGPGSSWFKARFIDVAPAETLYTDSKGMTRMGIHSTVFDNPYFLRDNAMYVQQLASIPNDTLRKQWFLGDFDALEGTFFGEFREKQRPGEPDHAYHVADPDKLELLPHWKRWISMDWGFSHCSAVLWHCKAADQRIYTYREMVDSRVGTREWGVRIGQASMQDLAGQPDRHMTLYLSPDAFARTDERNSEAEQIALGLADVLGRDSVFIVDFTDEEKSLPASAAWESLKRRQSAQRRTNITIQRAATNRTAGWASMRELMRWWPMLGEQTEPDHGVANNLLMEKGVMAYAEYMRQVSAWKDEVLPKWRVVGPKLDPVTNRFIPGIGCPKLIKGIQSVQHEEGKEDIRDTGTEAVDLVDSARYGLFNVNMTQNSPPRDIFVAETIAALGLRNAHSQYMAAVQAEKEFDRIHAVKPFMLPRNVGRHRRAMVQ